VFNTAQDGTAYSLTGPEDAPVLVLIHGLGLSSELWRAHLSAYANYRVLNYDLYGHGHSGPTPETASLQLYARQLSNLMDELELSHASIVGFSIGGMINRRFAIDFPDKLDKLIILNSPHDRGKDAQAQVEARAARVREQGIMATLPDALTRWFTPEQVKSGAGPAAVTAWRETVHAESYQQAAWVLAHGVRELICPEPAVRANALVMTCENDTGSTPAMAAAIAAEIESPGGSITDVLIVPRLRHLGLMEEPEQFTQPIIEFLGKH